MCETDRVAQYFTSRFSVGKEQKTVSDAAARSDENKTTII